MCCYNLVAMIFFLFPNPKLNWLFSCQHHAAAICTICVATMNQRKPPEV